MIAKSDIVRSRVMGVSGGHGFVHYILPDNMACVEFPVWGKTYIHTNDLEKVETDPKLNKLMTKLMR